MNLRDAYVVFEIFTQEPHIMVEYITDKSIWISKVTQNFVVTAYRAW